VKVLLALAALLLVGLGLVRRTLVAYDPPLVLEVPVRGAPAPGAPGADTLDVLSWNVGYAGLGSESDFVIDGGRHVRPSSRQLVERNLEAIGRRLRAEQADVLLLQELALPGFVTRGVDVLGRLSAELDGHGSAFAPTIRVSGLPLVGELEVGQGTFARHGLVRAVRHALDSPRALPGIRFQNFHVLESRVEADGCEWVFFNVHLAAFDDGSLRRKQLADVVRLLRAEYESGSHVVAGGDWNMRLADTRFPYSTAERHTSWVRDLPAGVTPVGWVWAVDPTSPTNRTLEQPYRPGVNYTSVIDGFLVSPNVDVLSVETVDLGFAWSDHNPVRLRVRRA
jgi:endonuclease/exonuclease/phosphatase family metal-dependent hydrolase